MQYVHLQTIKSRTSWSSVNTEEIYLQKEKKKKIILFLNVIWAMADKLYFYKQIDSSVNTENFQIKGMSRVTQTSVPTLERLTDSNMILNTKL